MSWPQLILEGLINAIAPTTQGGQTQGRGVQEGDLGPTEPCTSRSCMPRA